MKLRKFLPLIVVCIILFGAFSGFRWDNNDKQTDDEVTNENVLMAAPSTPRHLRADVHINGTDASVSLEWNHTRDSNVTFHIYKSQYEGTAWNESYRIGHSYYDLYYHDSDVEVGNTYYYRVSAENSDGESEMSEVLTVTIDDGDSASGSSSAGLSLFWIAIPLFVIFAIIGGVGIVWKRKNTHSRPPGGSGSSYAKSGKRDVKDHQGQQSNNPGDYQQDQGMDYQQDYREQSTVSQGWDKGEGTEAKTQSGFDTSQKQSIAEKKSNIHDEINSLEERESMIDTRAIESALEEGNIDKAERLLDELKENYENYKETIEELESLDQRKSSLATQLADEKIDRKTYNDAVNNIEHEKADLEEKLHKLREKVIHEDYEKPF